MKQLFATKRDANGNRLYLAIDHTERTFCREVNGWYHKSDITAEVTHRRIVELAEELEKEGYKGSSLLHI